MAEITAQAESFLLGLEAQAENENTGPGIPGLASTETAGTSVPADPAAVAMQLAAQLAAERFNQQFQAQQALQPGSGAPGELQQAEPAANGFVEHAQQPVHLPEQNGVQQAAAVAAATAEAAASLADGAATGRKRRNRWGPKEGEAPAAGEDQVPASAEGGTTPPPSEEPKRKRRSRWEEPAPEPSNALVNVGGGAFPKELVLPGGIKVSQLHPSSHHAKRPERPHASFRMLSSMLDIVACHLQSAASRGTEGSCQHHGITELLNVQMHVCRLHGPLHIIRSMLLEDGA